MPLPLETIVDSSDQDIGLKASVATNLQELMHAAAVQATQEIFVEQILPEAKALSPVGGVGDPHPGKNRDSIGVSFRDRIQSGWISAWIFTQSGYGWLIEHGTSFNRKLTRLELKKRSGKIAEADRTAARPYIYPAMRFCANIPQRAKEILESL